jgi:hypothetical protein
MLEIRIPVLHFNDKTGVPLSNGSIYIGVAGQNPITNPLQIYYDEGGTLPAAQPLKTTNGYIYRSGSPTNIYCNATDYSMLVRDKNGVLILTTPSIASVYNNAALAQPTAAGDIGYSHGSTGSVANTVANKLRELTSFEDFGAVGDGVTNDLVAINNALTASKVIYCKANTVYFVSAMPNINGHTIYGNGSTIKIGDVQQSITSETSFENIIALTIEGDNTYTTTLSAITAVTGSDANWSVTATLADATNVVIGDTVVLKNVTAGAPIPVGALTGRPPKGQLNNCLTNLGEITVTGTSATLTLSNATSHLANGDLVLLRGQVRTVSALTASSFTINAALTANIAGYQYWYRTVPLTGTVTVAGTTVTGVGTAFLTEMNVGDYIMISGSTFREVTAIATNLSLTIDEALTVGVASAYGSMAFGELHQGGWVVTGKTGNNITYINTCHNTAAKPPVNLITGGEVTIIKTNIKYTSTTNGVTVKGGQIVLKDISIIGNGTSTTTSGLNLNSGTAQYSANGILLGTVSISSFGYNVQAAGNSYIYGRGVSLCSGYTAGGRVAQGARAYFDSAQFIGNGKAASGTGLLLTEGAYARLSGAKFVANNLYGLRMEVGAATWSDFANYIKNGADGVAAIGGVNIHFVGDRFIGNIATGLELQNGGYGRVSGGLFIRNNNGIVAAGGKLEAQQISSIANLSNGIAASYLGFSCEEGAFAFNGIYGLYALKTTSVNMSTCHLTSNIGADLYLASKAVIYGDSVGFGVPVATSVFAINGGNAAFTNAIGLLTANVNIGLNSYNPIDGTVVSDGTATTSYKPLTATITANIGSIAANTTAIQTVTVAGATVDSDNFVVVGTSGNNPAGLILTAAVTAANTVTISLSNVSAAAIDPASQTYRVVVYKLS